VEIEERKRDGCGFSGGFMGMFINNGKEDDLKRKVRVRVDDRDKA